MKQRNKGKDGFPNFRKSIRSIEYQSLRSNDSGGWPHFLKLKKIDMLWSPARRSSRLTRRAQQQRDQRQNENIPERNARVTARRARSNMTVKGLAKNCDISDFDENEALTVLPHQNAGNFFSTVCYHCKAYRWKDEHELTSICCCNGEVKLHPLPVPLPAIVKYFDITQSGKSSLENIRGYNNALALAFHWVPGNHVSWI